MRELGWQKGYAVFWRVEIMAENAGRAKRGEVMDSGIHFLTVDRLAFHRGPRVVAYGHDEHSAMQRALAEMETIYQPELNLEFHPDIRKLVFPKSTSFPSCSECDKPIPLTLYEATRLNH